MSVSTPHYNFKTELPRFANSFNIGTIPGDIIDVAAKQSTAEHAEGAN
ncbi:MAG: hypothetical protein LBK60_11690 [Verrucomicrobiales bacterium]|nr:hypothetical protein [Verrucomicrobiales bacterium]